jgi:hypothetical protein
MTESAEAREWHRIIRTSVRECLETWHLQAKDGLVSVEALETLARTVRKKGAAVHPRRLTRQMHAGELASARSTTVLPPAVMAALARLRHAEDEYERARARDWRRSVVSLAMVLKPLADVVLRARMECRRIGVRPDGTCRHA